MAGRIKKKHVITVLLMLASIVISIGLSMKKPKARKARPTVIVPVVQTIALYPRNERVQVEAYGNVIPSRKIDLLTQVQGKAVYVSPELVPGGIFEKGGLVLEVDPRDYALLVDEKKAAVAEALYALELEKARQNVAKKEWKVLEGQHQGAKTNKSLALREPHLRNAMARLEAAQSSLQGAKLAQSRTKITSPFNALVLEKFIDLGQVAGPQRSIATLVDIDEYWVQVSVPVKKLKWLRFPGKNNTRGSAVKIVIETGKGQNQDIVRSGRVFKLLGDLDQKGRMARIIVSLKDPLGPKAGSRGSLLLGSYVKVIIEAGTLKNVYSIPRKAVHGEGRIWVLNKDSRLEGREVSVIWRRPNDLLVSKGVEPGDRLITSKIRSPLPGMKLKDEPDTSTNKAEQGQ